MTFRVFSQRLMVSLLASLILPCVVAAQQDNASAVKSLAQYSLSAKGQSSGSNNFGAAGGGTQADFTQLIDLITSTIAPATWDEVGGPGAITEFRGGIRIDASCILDYLQTNSPDLVMAKESARRVQPAANPHLASRLRKISLTRLDKAAQVILSTGRPLPEEMKYLAGLNSVEYLFIYPAEREIVIAGRADDWQTKADGRVASVSSGRPIIPLDDLVELLRMYQRQPYGVFGCSIDPVSESLAAAKAFLDETSGKSISPGQRPKWLATLKEKMGDQKVTISGVPQDSRVASVLAKADYHMKLVGMGSEKSVAGLKNYLDLIQIRPGSPPPNLEALRWWFTLAKQGPETNADGTAFGLAGVKLKLVAENEIVATSGERRHTGTASEANQEFTSQFTEHLGDLAQRYPIYAELKNVCDLACAMALLANHPHASLLLGDWKALSAHGSYEPAAAETPRLVPTVARQRVVQEKYVLTGVSGGVQLDFSVLIQPDQRRIDSYGRLSAEKTNSGRPTSDADFWWWD